MIEGNGCILVTGGSGFIGTNVIEHLIGEGNQVVNFDIAPPRNQAHRNLWKQVDIRDQAQLAEAFEAFDPHIVIHLAARTDLSGQSLADYESNTLGVENLVEACGRARSLKRVAFASTMLVCRIGYQPCDETDYHPNTAYGESKVVGEQIVRDASDLRSSWVIVRPTSIWGPWFDAPYRDFFMAVYRGLYVHPRGKRIYRSYGFVGNTVFELDCLINASEAAVHGKTFYLGDYPPIETLDWARHIREALGARPIREAPLGLLRLFASAGDLLKSAGYRNPLLTSFRLNNLLTENVYDLSGLERICGSLPYSMPTGVDETVKWMRQAGLTGR